MKTCIDVELVTFEVPSFVKTENAQTGDSYTVFISEI